jgi:proprotein convertase subtilisin/kexin type 2
MSATKNPNKPTLQLGAVQPHKTKNSSKQHLFIYSLCRAIPQDKSLFLTLETTGCAGSETEVNYLEHVQAVITLNTTRRGDVEVFMRSPMGTRSMILSTRPNDDDARDGFTKWPFMTSHTWAEYPRGKWSLEVHYIN